MDWARAIERNSEALKAIVAALFAMLGLTETAKLGRIPRALHGQILRLLRPAESAVRRLIVIAARGVVVKPSPVRPMPTGLKIAGKAGGRMAFQLFDPRKRFEPWHPKRIPDHKAPRVWAVGDDDWQSPLFRRPPVARVAPRKDETVDARRLGDRVMAIKQALETLPAQARRLVRWRMRRQAMASPKFTSPLRPGRPPGHRAKPKDEIDRVLKECHALARDVEIENTS
ncbi:MAG: hypothetical protein ACKVS5_12890 [Parvularculaceae bacterium]